MLLDAVSRASVPAVPGTSSRGAMMTTICQRSLAGICRSARTRPLGTRQFGVDLLAFRRQFGVVGPAPINEAAGKKLVQDSLRDVVVLLDHPAEFENCLRL